MFKSIMNIFRKSSKSVESITKPVKEKVIKPAKPRKLTDEEKSALINDLPILNHTIFNESYFKVNITYKDLKEDDIIYIRESDTYAQMKPPGYLRALVEDVKPISIYMLGKEMEIMSDCLADINERSNSHMKKTYVDGKGHEDYDGKLLPVALNSNHNCRRGYIFRILDMFMYKGSIEKVISNKYKDSIVYCRDCKYFAKRYESENGNGYVRPNSLLTDEAIAYAKKRLGNDTSDEDIASFLSVIRAADTLPAQNVCFKNARIHYTEKITSTESYPCEDITIDGELMTCNEKNYSNDCTDYERSNKYEK